MPNPSPSKNRHFLLVAGLICISGECEDFGDVHDPDHESAQFHESSKKKCLMITYLLVLSLNPCFSLRFLSSTFNSEPAGRWGRRMSRTCPKMNSKFYCKYASTAQRDRASNCMLSQLKSIHSRTGTVQEVKFHLSQVSPGDWKVHLL